MDPRHHSSRLTRRCTKTKGIVHINRMAYEERSNLIDNDGLYYIKLHINHSSAPTHIHFFVSKQTNTISNIAAFHDSSLNYLYMAIEEDDPDELAHEAKPTPSAKSISIAKQSSNCKGASQVLPPSVVR